MNKTLNDIQSSIKLRDAIRAIMESSSLKVGVKTVCDKYTNLLDNGYRQEELCESFINDMTKFSSLSDVNKNLASLSMMAESASQKNNISMIRDMQSMKRNHPEAYSMLEGVVVEYLATKTDESAKAMKTKLSMFAGYAEVSRLMEGITVDEYAKRLGRKVDTVEMVAEQEVPTVYTKEQVDKMVADALAESKKADAAALEDKTSKSLYSLEDKVKLAESINTILKKESRNAKVKAVCEQFINELRNGKSSYALCESFISTMGPFGYLNAVDTELSALTSKISKYKQEINLVKIVEAMRETTSYYIVPLIEEAVVNYVKNKCQPTRVMLMQACESFRSDPFVRDIIFIVNSDQSIDQFRLGNSIPVVESVHVTSTFSPVQYINENAYIFNAFGNYYTKKDNSITKLSKEDVTRLDESFKHVCECVNANTVKYDATNDCIEVYGLNTVHKAQIFESGKIVIDGAEVDLDKISTPQWLGMAQYEGSYEFYDKVISLARCNTIANIDFVKRITMNESNKSVDIFRAGDRISISLNEGSNSQFRSNINPIRCRKYVNEHMEINVGEMFSDIMPDQKLLESSIDDAKNAYESYLETLNNSKKELLQMKESGECDEDAEKVDAMIGALDKEINDITDNYKKIQKDADELVGDTEDGDTEGNTDDPGDKPASDMVKGEVSEPMTGEGGEGVDDATDTQGAGEEPTEVTDIPAPEDHDFDPYNDMTDDTDEFDSILDTPAPIESEDGIKIQDVSFEKNIKTGKVANRGTVTILIPTVNSNGDVRNEIKSVTFTLDGNRNPIINNDYMQLSMYNAILAAIKSSPEVEKVDVAQGAAQPTPPVDQVATPATGDDLLGFGSDKGLDDILPDFGDDQILELPTEEGSSVITPEAPAPAQTNTDVLDSDVNKVVDDTKKFDTKDTDENITDPLFKADAKTTVPNKYPFNLVIAKDDVVMCNSGRDMTGPFSDYLNASAIDFVEKQKKADNGDMVDAYVIRVKDVGDVKNINKFMLDILGYPEEAYYKVYVGMMVECMNIERASKIYEAIANDGGITVEFPHDDELFKVLRRAGFEVESEHEDVVTISVPGQYDELITTVKDWVTSQHDLPASYKKEIMDRINRYRLDGGDMIAKRSSGLENGLDKAGIDYTYDGQNLNIPVTDMYEAKKVLELSKKYDFVKEGIETLDRMVKLNEGILITIEDTETHKKITVDTDDLEKEGKTDDENKDGDKESDTAFDDSTELFNTKEEADAAKGNGDNQQGSDTPNESATQEPMKAKKKFKFKSKKTNESVVEYPTIGSGSKVIYTDKNGNKFNADVTGVRSEGKYIIIVKGHTIVTDGSKIKLAPISQVPTNPELNNIDLVGMKTK